MPGSLKLVISIKTSVAISSKPRKIPTAMFLVWLAYDDRTENEQKEGGDVGRGDRGDKVPELSSEELLAKEDLVRLVFANVVVVGLALYVVGFHYS